MCLETIQLSADKPQFVCESAAPHRILKVNEAWLDACGFSSEEVLGRTPGIIQGEATESAAIKSIEKAVASRTPLSVAVTNYTKERDAFANLLNIELVSSAAGEEYFVASSDLLPFPRTMEGHIFPQPSHNSWHHVEELRLDGFRCITDAHLCAISKHCPALARMDISLQPWVSAKGVRCFSEPGAPRLAALAAEGCTGVHAGDAELSRLAQHAGEKLEVLMVGGWNGPIDRHVVSILHSCPSLRKLSLCCTALTDEGLSSLLSGSTPQLQWLDVDKCALSSSMLASLEGCGLRKLKTGKLKTGGCRGGRVHASEQAATSAMEAALAKDDAACAEAARILLEL